MKNKIITTSFLLIIFGLFFANLFYPAQENSYSERRRLAQFPKLSVEGVLNGENMKAFDKYAADQFIGRETFRGIKTIVDRNILLKSDTNGLFKAQDNIFKIEYPLNEDKVINICNRLNELYNSYLTDMNIYYSIIPDKNYYLPDNGEYLLMDYEKMKLLMNQNMPSKAEYIDIFNVLTLDNYYQSDGHWRQETLKPVIDTLNKSMSIPQIFDLNKYEQKSYAPFYGAYYGQMAGIAEPDTIIWLKNEVTNDAKVTSLGHPGKENLPIYYEEGLSGMDSYDVFLYGAQPLIILDNPHNTSGRELILVRDSYGSSLAPLLLEGYSRITLVDLRYITQDLLADYISFKNQDVLFMFSTTIINNSDIIR